MAGALGFEDYLRQTFNATQPSGTPTVMLGGGGAPVPPPPVAGPPALPSAPAGGVYDDAAAVSRPAPPAPAATVAPASPAGPPPPPPQQPEGLPGWNLVRAGSGVATIPAKEMDLRGPTLKAAQGVVNQTNAETVGRVGDRNENAAAAEYGMYLEQERGAQMRQRAAEQATAERDEELFQRQQDFDQSVKALSQASMDPDRFWSSRSTGQKIAGMVGVALGGFLQGARGGSNPAVDMINTAIERDLKAQEMGYMAARDTANAKQNAFSMAMQKFGSVDAARALARASALDAVQSQLGQMKALYAGTEAANRADMAMAQIEQDKMNQIAQGVRFIPQQQVAVGAWVDPRTGLRYTDAEAKGLSKDYEGREHAKDLVGLNTAGDVIKEGAKSNAQRDKDLRAQLVQLPNGDVVRAPSDTEAGKLRDLSQAVRNAQALVNEAKTIRSGSNWRFPGTKDRARLEAIQSELTLSFKDRGGLGALSGPDMDLAMGATGDITGQRGTSDAKLDSFMGATNRALRARVASIPDAPGTAKGEMPSSFRPAGKK